MKIGTLLPWSGTLATPSALTKTAQTLDTLGYDHVNVGEHLFYPKEKVTLHPHNPDGEKYGLDPSGINLEMFTLFSYLAGQTERLRFNSYLLIPCYRSPFAVAKMVATLDYLSGGRLTLGVGIGWLKEEFEVLNIPFEERGARTDEAVAIMRALFSDDTRFEGKYYDVPDVYFEPKPVQDPFPIWMGGNTIHALRRVARYAQGWVPLMAPDEMGEKVPQLKDFMAAAGRGGDALDIAGSLPVTEETTKDALLTGAAIWQQAGANVINLSFGELEQIKDLNYYLDRLSWFGEEVLPSLKPL